MRGTQGSISLWRRWILRVTIRARIHTTRARRLDTVEKYLHDEYDSYKKAIEIERGKAYEKEPKRVVYWRYCVWP